MNTLINSKVVPLRRQSSQGDLSALLEAVLFDAAKPMSLAQLVSATTYDEEVIQQALANLEAHLASDSHGLCLLRSGDMVQLAPKPMYHGALEQAREADETRNLVVVDQFLHHLNLAGRRPGTLKAYGEFLRRFIREVGRPIDEIRTRDVRFFFDGGRDTRQQS